MEILAKIVVFLFFPWVDALMRASYNEYMMDRLGNEHLASNASVRQFLQYHSPYYMQLSLKKHWWRIVFMPWTIVTSQELYEYGPSRY